MAGWILFLIGFALGIFLPGVFFVLIFDKWYAGKLREDRSIPDEPYYFMEIDQGRSGRLASNKFVMLRIERQNYIQKEDK